MVAGDGFCNCDLVTGTFLPDTDDIDLYWGDDDFNCGLCALESTGCGGIGEVSLFSCFNCLRGTKGGGDGVGACIGPGFLAKPLIYLKQKRLVPS